MDKPIYLWKFEIILKSGKELVAYDKNSLADSNKVANEFIAGNQDDIISLGNKEGTANILVKKNEIAVMTISVG